MSAQVLTNIKASKGTCQILQSSASHVDILKILFFLFIYFKFFVDTIVVVLLYIMNILYSF